MGEDGSFTWRRGAYASDPIDQHETSWCGFCFVIAVVQCVEDRGYILMDACSPRATRVRLDLQSVVDEFSDVYRRNACHGGRSSDVLDCLARGACRLRRAPSPARWRGHPARPPPRTSSAATEEDDVPFVVIGYATPRTVDEVRRHIARDGPVVLAVHSDTLKTVDARGVVTDLSPRPPNHSVSVVGWTRDDHWIVRNSWGHRRVPKRTPLDMSCVSFEANDCEVEWETWSGGDPTDPGFLYLPMRLASLHPPHPCPWLVPLVRRRPTLVASSTER